MKVSPMNLNNAMFFFSPGLFSEVKQLFKNSSILSLHLRRKKNKKNGSYNILKCISCNLLNLTHDYYSEISLKAIKESNELVK